MSLNSSLAAAMAEAANGAMLGELIGQLEGERNHAVDVANQWAERGRRLEHNNAALREKINAIGQHLAATETEVDRLKHSGGQLWHRMQCLERALRVASTEVATAHVLIAEFSAIIDKHGLANELPADLDRRVTTARDEFLASGSLCFEENSAEQLKGSDLPPSSHWAVFSKRV